MSQTKKIALLSMLFIYTVMCGIIIADSGTSAVAGSDRPNLTEKFIKQDFLKLIFLK